MCLKSDSHELTVVQFFIVGTTAQWTRYKEYLDTLESRWAGLTADYAIGSAIRYYWLCNGIIAKPDIYSTLRNDLDAL